MKKKTPPPAPPADPPAPPEKGKVSAAILEELKVIRGQNDRIEKLLTPPKGAAARRRNMYGETVDEEE